MILKSNKPHGIGAAIVVYLCIFCRKALQHPRMIHRYTCFVYVYIVTIMIRGWWNYYSWTYDLRFIPHSCPYTRKGGHSGSLCCMHNQHLIVFACHVMWLCDQQICKWWVIICNIFPVICMWLVCTLVWFFF